MEPRSAERPRSVLVGAVVVAVAALFLFAQAWDSLGALGSEDTQKELRRAVGAGTSQLSVGELTSIVRVVYLTAAAAAAASVVFAAYAVRGRADARIGLIATGVVAGIGGILIDPVLDGCYVFGAFLVAGSTQARAWFAGRPIPRAQPGRSAGPEEPTSPPPTTKIPTRITPSVKAPTLSISPTVVVSAPAASSPSPARSGQRPPVALVAAVRLAWIGALLGLAASTGVVVATVVDRTGIIAWARERFGLDPLRVSALQVSALVIAGLVVVGAACIVVALLALAVRRGSAAARFFLLIMLLLVAGGGLAAVSQAHLASAIALPVGVASIAGMGSVLLLLAPSVSVHFGDRPGGGGPGAGGTLTGPPEYGAHPDAAEPKTPAPDEPPAGPDSNGSRLPPVWSEATREPCVHTPGLSWRRNDRGAPAGAESAEDRRRP